MSTFKKNLASLSLATLCILLAQISFQPIAHSETELSPKEIAEYFNKGNQLLALGRFEEAVECYDLVLENSPNFVDAYLNKGGALLSLVEYA